MKRKPDFIVVGAAKAGTTSLFHYLNQHPDIFIPSRKECRFYSQMSGDFNGPGAVYQNDVIRDVDIYENLFDANKLMSGDISNDYLYYAKKSANNILTHLGSDVKIIIVLRNPVIRAYSNYLHHVREGWERLNFEEALIHEDQRILDNWAWPWFYKKTGCYFDQVKIYKETFRNVKVYFYEDGFLSPDFFTSIFEFLGVETSFRLDTSERHNTSGVPKHKWINQLLRSDNKLMRLAKYPIKNLLPQKLRTTIRKNTQSMNLRRTEMPSATRSYLQNFYRSDVEKLQDLLDRNLVELWDLK